MTDRNDPNEPTIIKWTPTWEPFENISSTLVDAYIAQKQENELTPPIVKLATPVQIITDKEQNQGNRQQPHQIMFDFSPCAPDSDIHTSPTTRAMIYQNPDDPNLTHCYDNKGHKVGSLLYTKITGPTQPIPVVHSPTAYTNRVP